MYFFAGNYKHNQYELHIYSKKITKMSASWKVCNNNFIFDLHTIVARVHIYTKLGRTRKSNPVLLFDRTGVATCDPSSVVGVKNSQRGNGNVIQ